MSKDQSAKGFFPVGKTTETASAPSVWITQGNLTRAALRLALPMAGWAVLNDLFVTVDMVFVGRLGPTAIAAVTVSGTAVFIIYTLSFGITTGLTALVAQAVGAGEQRRAENVAAQGLIMASIVSLLVALIGIPLAEDYLRALGADENVVAMGKSYLQVSIGGSLATVALMTFSAAMRSAGDAVTPLVVMGAANVINIVLDPILIFGWLGVPAMGVVGSAWATVIARFIGLFVFTYLLFVRGLDHFRIHLSDLRLRAETVLRIIRIGVFGSGQMFVRNLSVLALVRIVAMFGEVPLAAYGVVTRLFMVFLMPGIAFGNVAATLVGQNLGAGSADRATRAGWVTTRIYAIIALVGTIVFMLFAEWIIAIFNTNPEVVRIGATYLRWVSSTFVFVAVALVLGRAMFGAGDTFWPMVIVAVAVLGLRIPLAFGLAWTWNDVDGVWIAVAGTNMVQGFLFAGLFWWGRWKIIGRALVKSMNY